MQCTCPLSDNAHNNNNNSDLLNRRHHDHHLEQYQSQKQLNNKANAVQWHSSQTLPNPKRRRYNTNNTRDSTSCSCNSAACVFSSHNNNNSTSRRNVIDPRSGNPVKSCLNLSSTTAASRGPCYLCSRSQSLPRPRIQHDQQRQQHRQRNQRNNQKQNQENLPLGPYLVSNPQLVTPHHHPQQPEHNNNCGYNCSRLRYSSNNSVNNNYPRVPPSAECVAQ